MDYVNSKLIAVAAKFKCDFNNAETFFDVVRPFYFLAKIFGYSPFTLPKNTSWDSQQSTSFDLMTSVVSFALYFFLLYSQLSAEKLFSHGVLVIDIAEDILLVYLTCISIVSTVLLLLLRRHVWNLINDIARVDSKMSSIGINISYQKHYQFVVVYILTFLLIQIGGMTYTCVYLQKHYDPAMKSKFKCLHACLIYFYGIGAFTTTMSYYYLPLLCVNSRLRQTNEYIKNIFIQSTEVDSKDVDRCLIVRQISKIYDGLCDIVEMINFCFSFQVMALVTACFGFIVFCVFTLYKALTYQHSNENVFLRNLALNLMWNFYYTSVGFLIIYVGSNLSYQMVVACRVLDVDKRHGRKDHVTRGMMIVFFYVDSNLLRESAWMNGRKTGVLIHKAIHYVKDVKLIDQLRLFSQQLQHRTPVATCGLFPFDWTLLYSTFAASVTYLIILIQFDTSSTTEKAFSVNESQHHHGNKT